MKTILLAVIGFYQKAISPFTPATCRFDPTCSEYARQAVVRFGALRGGGLALKRLLRCHPFGSHGYDPVPQRRAASMPNTSPLQMGASGAAVPQSTHAVEDAAPRGTP